MMVTVNRVELVPLLICEVSKKRMEFEWAIVVLESIDRLLQFGQRFRFIPVGLECKPLRRGQTGLDRARVKIFVFHQRLGEEFR